MTSDTNLLNDEIDIRELIQTLFRQKWVILGFTFVVAVAVLVFSKFATPRMYSSQAQVIFTKPLSSTNLDPSIQSTPQTPEASALRELALDDALLQSVYASPEVSAILDKKLDFDQFKSNLSARLTGTSKLALAVSSKKPETAAIIVNVWADQFITQINTLYSINEKTLALISNQTQDARQKWDAAEQTLLQKLPDAMADTQEIALTNKQSALTFYMNTATQLDLIVKDAQSFRSRMAIWPDNSKLGLESQVSLISLYQRAASGLVGSPVQGLQLQIAAPSVENVRTVAEAKASVDALITSLNDEQAQLQSALEQLRQDITAATQAFETANYQLTQLTTERDLAQNAYKALSAQLEESRIDLAREDVVAKLVGKALPPELPVSNRTLTKTLIAGVLAFVVSCFGVLFISWWKSSEPVKPAS